MSTLNTCTSSTRPSSPSTGDMLFETDTNKCIIYDGAAWRTADPKFSLDQQLGDWKVITDNYGADSYTHKYDGSAFAGSNNAQIGAFNTKRLDPDGAAYHHADSFPNMNYISSTTSSPYNLSSLQSSDSGLYTARAMRFRCKRPEGGAGFFSIWHFAMLKGASGHGGAFRNLTHPYQDGIKSYIGTQNQAGHVIGYNTYNGIHKVDGSNFGTSFFPSGKDEWVCKTEDLTGDPAGCQNPDFDDSQNRGLAFFKDTDPTSEGIASKTDGSDWIRTPSYAGMSFGDSNHTTRTFNTALLGMFMVDHANYMPTFGIKVGSGAPAELYFTFFFATSMNITNLEGITWNPRCDQAGSEVSIEFLMT